jgi:hypothetical protein
MGPVSVAQLPWPHFGHPRTLNAAIYCAPVSSIPAGQRGNGQIADRGDTVYGWSLASHTTAGYDLADCGVGPFVGQMPLAGLSAANDHADLCIRLSWRNARYSARNRRWWSHECMHMAWRSAWVVTGWGVQDKGAIGLKGDLGPEPVADPFEYRPQPPGVLGGGAA